MTFNFDAAPKTVLALEREIASEVLVVATTG
jgi:hypothetical protein